MHLYNNIVALVGLFTAIVAIVSLELLDIDGPRLVAVAGSGFCSSNSLPSSRSSVALVGPFAAIIALVFLALLTLLSLCTLYARVASQICSWCPSTHWSLTP